MLHNRWQAVSRMLLPLQIAAQRPDACSMLQGMVAGLQCLSRLQAGLLQRHHRQE